MIYLISFTHVSNLPHRFMPLYLRINNDQVSQKTEINASNNLGAKVVNLDSFVPGESNNKTRTMVKVQAIIALYAVTSRLS